MNQREEDLMDKIVTKLSEYIEQIHSCQNKSYPTLSKDNDMLIYRGQGNKGWKCLPKLFRQKKWFENETKIINEVLRQSPEEFYNLSPFEKLVKMQHYGVPTRLLDFTGNPMIALYFACSDKSQENEDGVVLVSKFPMFFENQILLQPILNRLFPDANNLFVQLNKDAIETINGNSLAMGVIPKLGNHRIKNQDGYFVLFSYSGEYINKDVFNPIEKNESIKERLIIPSANKKEILEELNLYGIKEAFVFPELEKQIACVLDKYK